MPKSKSKKSSSFYYSAEDNNIPRQPLFPIEGKQKTKKIRPPRPKRPYAPPKKTKKVRPPRPERPYAPPRHSRRAPFKIMPQQKLRKYSTPPMVEEAIEPVFKNPRKLSKKGSMEVGYNSKEDLNQNLYNNNYQPINSYNMETDAMVPNREVISYYKFPPIEVQKEFKKKPSLEKKLSHFLKTRRNRRNFSMEGQTPLNKESLPLSIHYNSNSFEYLGKPDNNSYEEEEILDYISNFMYSLKNQFHKYCRKNRVLIEEMDHKLMEFCRRNGVDLQKEVFGRGLIVGTEPFDSKKAIFTLLKSKDLNIPPSAEMISLVNVFEAEISKPKKTGKFKRMVKSYRGTQYDDSKLDRYFRFSLFTIIQRNAINYLRFRNNNLFVQDLQNSLYYCFFPNNDGSIRKVDIKKVFFAESEEPLKELNIKLGSEFMTELKNVQRLMKKGGAAAPTDVGAGAEAVPNTTGEGAAATGTNAVFLDPSQINLAEMVNVSRTALDSELSRYYDDFVKGFIEFCKIKGDDKKASKEKIKINKGRTTHTLNSATLNLEKLLKPGRISLLSYSKDYKPLLEMMIDLKRGQEVAKKSTHTYRKMITQKLRGLATATGFMENEKEISIEEKLYDYILESFLKDERYQEVRDSIPDFLEIKNKLALVFRDIISLGLVTTPETDEKEIEKRKLEIRKILTKKPGVKGRKKTKKKKRNLSK